MRFDTVWISQHIDTCEYDSIRFNLNDSLPRSFPRSLQTSDVPPVFVREASDAVQHLKHPSVKQITVKRRYARLFWLFYVLKSPYRHQVTVLAVRGSDINLINLILKCFT